MVVNKWAAGFLLLSLLSLGAIGCDSSGGPGGGASMEEVAAQVEAQKAAQQQQEQAQQEAARQAQEAAAAAAAQQQQQQDQQQRQLAGRAQVEPGGGYFRAIIGARRHVLNVADKLPWLQAVQHFQAEHGRLPKDHAEFMSRVVQPLDIDLGYIEEGQEFLYDPSEGDWGELYVVEKAPTTTPQ